VVLASVHNIYIIEMMEWDIHEPKQGKNGEDNDQSLIDIYIAKHFELPTFSLL